jgi:DNA polymerase III alpha subunit
MDISVCVPDLRNLNRFFILKNNCIHFGLTDIKGFGDSVFKKLTDIVQNNNIDLNTMSWPQILFGVLLKINSMSAKALIKSGGLSFLKKTRSSMMFEYDIASSLTKTELDYISSKIDLTLNLYDIISLLKNKERITKKRLDVLNSFLHAILSPPYSMDDNPEWISDAEEEVLGCSITCSKVDMYDITMTNCNCKEFKTTLNKDNIIVCGEIESISVTKTKTGKSPGSEMAFVSISDSYGCIDSVIFFPDAYKTHRNILFDNNVIIVKGKKNNTGDSLIVEKAYIPRT